MSINLRVPEREGVHEMKPRIVVVGVGGAGGNAVNDMIASQLEGVEFLVANTDAQALSGSKADRRVQIGATVTGGLGAGAKPDVGRAAAEESLNEIMEHLDGCNMAFVAAGMGGGTGTGAAPIIAKSCREKGILTVGVVTKPFQFEGVHRMRLAEAGIEELEQYVDTLIVIPNQNLFRIANEKTTFADAFRMADQVLYSGVRGVTDLMIMPGMINLDFADIRSVMSEMGKAMMGTGEAEGEDRAIQAAQAAIANPLLDDTSMKGAKGVLINITGGDDMTLYEVDEAANRIRSEVDEEAYIIFGSAFDGELQGRIRVSVVATGIDANAERRPAPVVLRAEAPAVSRPAVPEAAKPAEPLVPFRAPEPAVAEVMAAETDVAPAVAEVDENQPEMFEAPAEVEAETAATEVEVTADAASDSTDEPAEAETEVEAEVETKVDETAAEAPVAEAAAVEEPAPVETPAETPAPAVAEKASTPPAAMPAQGATDAFIPPKPVAADGRESPAPSNPFAVSDMVNGGKGSGESNVAELPKRKKGGNLLDRIMGKGQAAKAGSESAPQPLDWKSEKPTEPSRIEPTVSSDHEPPRAASTGTDGGQPSLGGLTAGEPMPRSAPEEDLLDIPAFLRRQAN